MEHVTEIFEEEFQWEKLQQKCHIESYGVKIYPKKLRKITSKNLRIANLGAEVETM
jgi:hypothetical protein